MDGADYLARSNAGAPPALGKRVVVIGGGSAALDVARSARRAGHEVTILALERAEQMPAQREEVAEALEEGIALVDGAMLTAVTPTDGHRAGAATACACASSPARCAGSSPSSRWPTANSRWRPTPSSSRSARTPTWRRWRIRSPSSGGLLRGRRAPGRFGARRVGRRRRGQHGALRDRGDRHGQARRARHRPRAERPAGAGRRPRGGEPLVGLAQHRHLLPPEAGARRRAAPPAGRAAGQRRRGAARPRARAGAGRGRALLLLRHLHPVRQLRPLLPRPRGQARARAATRC